MRAKVPAVCALRLPPNKPLERAGTMARADVSAASAGR
jgi:hypothetical protein